MNTNPSSYPTAPANVASPQKPAGKRRSVGVAILLETLIPGAGFVYAGRLDTGIFDFVISLAMLLGFVVFDPVAFAQTYPITYISGIGFLDPNIDPSALDTIEVFGVVVIAYAFVRNLGTARSVFARNNRVAGSSRPLARLAALISLLSSVAVLLGAELYVLYQRTCTFVNFTPGFIITCASPVAPYRLIGDVLLISGAIGLLIGLIG